MSRCWVYIYIASYILNSYSIITLNFTVKKSNYFFNKIVNNNSTDSKHSAKGKGVMKCYSNPHFYSTNLKHQVW